MSQLIPTRAGLTGLTNKNLQWSDAVNAAEAPDQVQPVGDSPTRQAYLSGDYIYFIEPGKYEGEDCRLLVGVGRRNREGQVMRQVEWAKGPKSSKRGGSGRMLPTSYDEILQRIDAMDGWWYDDTRRHLAVHGPNGEQVTMPRTASDWRALANMVGELRRHGCDVRRPGPAKKSA